MSQNNLNNDEQFRDVINSLKSLKKVDAPPGFNADLLRKITQQTPVPAQSLWEKIINSFLFVPAAGATVVAAVVILFLSIQPQQTTDVQSASAKSVNAETETQVDSLPVPPQTMEGNTQTAVNDNPAEKKKPESKIETKETKTTGGTYPTALQSKPEVNKLPAGESPALSNENTDRAADKVMPLNKMKPVDSIAAKKKAPAGTNKKADKKPEAKQQ